MKQFTPFSLDGTWYTVVAFAHSEYTQYDLLLGEVQDLNSQVVKLVSGSLSRPTQILYSGIGEIADFSSWDDFDQTDVGLALVDQYECTKGS